MIVRLIMSTGTRCIFILVEAFSCWTVVGLSAFETLEVAPQHVVERREVRRMRGPWQARLQADEPVSEVLLESRQG